MLAGAANETVALAFPPTALTVVGAPGTEAGVTLLDGADDEPVPTAFLALTVNVYAMPLVNPLTVIGAATAPGNT